jgi:hypothetical protein
MTRAYNTATTQQNTGGAVAGVTAGKNAVINGGFDIWQRGTTSAGSASSPYTADRWQLSRSGDSGATVTRQVTGDTTNLPFIQYSARIQRNSGNTSLNLIYFSETLETVNSIPYAGRTITLSFYAKKGANFSAAASDIQTVISSGTGTDQNIVSGFTGQTNVITGVQTLTTTWQRFTLTGTVASTATQLAIIFYYGPSGTAGANDWFEITGVQLEVGSVATPFSRAGGTIQGELAACQRYFQAFNRNGIAYIGSAFSTTQAYTAIQFVQTMRTAPTVTLATAGQTLGTISFLNDSAGYPATTGTHSVLGATADGFEFTGSGYSASFARGGANALYCNGSQNLYTASAEL